MGELVSSPHEAMSTEVAIEARVAKPNPFALHLLEVAKERGIRVVLLSDMYLGKAAIKRTWCLLGAGVPAALYEQLLVSSEFGVSKHGGELFERMLALYPGVAKERILHLGDNYASDVVAPRAHGLLACHYDSLTDNPSGVLALEAAQFPEGTRRLDPVRNLAQATDERADRDPNDEGKPWFAFGAEVLGPFVASYADWVVRMRGQ